MNTEEQITGEQTALVKVNPSADVLVERCYAEALELKRQAEEAVVAEVADLAPATERLSLIAQLRKTMEAYRVEYTKPLNGYVKAINEAFKRQVEPIEEADRILRGKVLAFQEEQRKRREEVERINRLRREAAEAESALTGAPVGRPQSIPIPYVHARATTDTGAVGQRNVRKWEVLDFAAVPDEYKTIDNGRVTRAVKAGIGAIPGIRIYEEKTLTVETATYKGGQLNGHSDAF